MTQTLPVRLAPLYAAGFVTAFGAHSVAAGLGAEAGADIGQSLLRLGILLALYDIAEVFLKPVFGALSDRIGAKPVIVGGLFAFAGLSLLGLRSGDPTFLALARLGQGAAAAAFSPASSATVARLAGAGRSGRYFGRYGSWKGLGYTVGPLLGAVLIAVGGLPALFAALSLLAAVAAVWVLLSLPAVEPLPRQRYTVVDLVRQTTDRRFLVPTLVLATSTAALGAAIGFLPALAVRAGAPTWAGIALTSVLALTSAVVQPRIGALRDQVALLRRFGAATGLLVIAAGVLLAAGFTAQPWMVAAAVLIGLGIGVVTPCAFSALADSTPPDRLGRTMGSAELGRELGDSAGPLLVGAVATAVALPVGLAVLGATTLVVAGVAGVTESTRPTPEREAPTTSR